MTENEIILEKQIADDLSAVLKEAKEMGCKEVAYFRHIPLQNVETVIKALEEIQQYRAIGTIEEFKALKEKSVAKKQGNINDFDSHLKLSKAGFLCCSSTNKDIRYPLISLSDLDYCPRCGQKLDWQ